MASRKAKTEIANYVLGATLLLAIGALVTAIVNAVTLAKTTNDVDRMKKVLYNIMGVAPGEGKMGYAAAWLDCELNGNTHDDMEDDPSNEHSLALQDCRRRQA